MTCFSASSSPVFSHFIDQKKIPHALLFYGSKDSYVEFFARQLAIDFFCLYQSSDYCEKTKSRIENDTFTDLHFFHFDKNIKVEEVKEWQELVAYGPTEHQYKVIVISGCETLTKTAANAFLKTLEEPPKGICFFLCTTLLPRVEPTIQSRCQMVYCASQNKSVVDAYIKNQPQCIQDFYADHYDVLSPSSNDLPQFHSLLSMDLIQRLTLSETLAKQPLLIQPLLYEWLGSITPDQSNHQDYFEQVLSCLKSFDAPVNTRLQLDRLFLVLPSSS